MVFFRKAWILRFFKKSRQGGRGAGRTRGGFGRVRSLHFASRLLALLAGPLRARWRGYCARFGSVRSAFSCRCAARCSGGRPLPRTSPTSVRFAPCGRRPHSGSRPARLRVSLRVRAFLSPPCVLVPPPLRPRVPCGALRPAALRSTSLPPLPLSPHCAPRTPPPLP